MISTVQEKFTYSRLVRVCVFWFDAVILQIFERRGHKASVATVISMFGSRAVNELLLREAHQFAGLFGKSSF